MSTSFDFSSYLPFTPSSQTPLSLCSSSSSLSSLSSLSPSSHSVVLLSIAPSSYPSSSDFVSLFRVLSPSGSLLISTSPESLSQLKSDLILSGFAEVSALNEDRGVVKATKPSWEKGAAAPLSFLRKPTTTTVNGNGSGSSSSSSKWTIGGTVEDDLVDEDDLLEREQEKVTKKGPTNFDCGTGSSTTKRKACKGCTCGLAEEEVAAEKAGAPAPQKEVGKGCGSCGLGDAFRCSTCPFLGQPAFSTTVGDKVKLEL